MDPACIGGGVLISIDAFSGWPEIISVLEKKKFYGETCVKSYFSRN